MGVISYIRAYDISTLKSLPIKFKCHVSFNYQLSLQRIHFKNYILLGILTHLRGGRIRFDIY